MAASYPTAVKAFTSKNTGDVVQATHVNDLQDEVTAIENALLNGLAHVLTVSAFGVHAISKVGTGAQRFRVRNESAGTANYAAVELGNDSASVRAALEVYSSTYTSTGPTQAEGAYLYCNGAGGLSLAAAHASGAIRLYINGTLRTQLTSTSLLEHNAGFALSGILSPAQITANQNNYAPTDFATSFWLRLTSDAARDITGLAGGAQGRIVALSNQGSFTITLKHEVTSTAANRFQCPGGVDYSLTTASSVLVYYDSSASRWYVLG